MSPILSLLAGTAQAAVLGVGAQVAALPEGSYPSPGVSASFRREIGTLPLAWRASATQAWVAHRDELAWVDPFAGLIVTRVERQASLRTFELDLVGLQPFARGPVVPFLDLGLGLTQIGWSQGTSLAPTATAGAGVDARTSVGRLEASVGWDARLTRRVTGLTGLSGAHFQLSWLIEL